MSFIAAVTIIPFMPNGWAASAGEFPAVHGNVPFLVKDVLQALRELLTPAVLQDLLSSASGKTLGRALRRCRRLQPGQTERAIWCHQALSRTVREDLCSCGWVDTRCAEALRLLVVYVEQAGWELADGRWVVAPALDALPASALAKRGGGHTAIEPSAWALGLSAEAAARLRASLGRLRHREPPTV